MDGLAFFGTPLAIESLSRAIELAPNRAEVYRARAWSNLELGEFKAALADFDRIAALDPSDPDTSRGRGWVRLFLGEHSGAVSDFTEALRRRPAQPEVIAARGVARYLSGRLAEARDDLRSSMRFRPTANGARTINLRVFDDWQRHRRALKLLQDRANANAVEVDAWHCIGVLNYRQLDDAQGLSGEMAAVSLTEAAFDRALKIDAGNIDVLMSRAAFNATPFVRYRPEVAIADLTEVIRLNPSHAEAYFRRALIRLSSRQDIAAAVADADRAVTLRPGDSRVVALRDRAKAELAVAERARQAAAIRAEQQKADADVAVALFLAGLATIVVTSEPRADGAYNAQQQFLGDLAADLWLNRSCRTSTGRPC